jgi:trans-2,3-dihydro-3-hydroxyanthranilate isomerase
MEVSFITCDVFTERAFSGNQLLVVPDATGLTTAQMQAVAREINYSESTFVLPPKDPRNAYLQRTFVPVKEIPYAGHPTIGTAFVMASLGAIGAGNGGETASITIEVGFGALRLELLKTDGVLSRVRMDQGAPVWDEPIRSVEILGRIAAGLGISFEDLGARDLAPQVVSTGNRFLMVPVASVEALAAASSDARVITMLDEELSILGPYAYAFGEDGRIRARGFFPGAGIAEDPATGSAAGPLGIHLSIHGALPGGSARFFIDQGVEMGRPSEIEVEALLADGRPVGVRVAGSAVLMMRGTLSV